MEEKLKEEIMKKSVNGRITCASARSIAETMGVSYKAVGETADLLGIRIKDCQLGCF